MNHILKGTLSYESLINIIIEKYETPYLSISHPSVNYLQDELINRQETRNYFACRNLNGDTSTLSLTNDEIIELIKQYGENNNIIVNSVKFDQRIEVIYQYKKGLNVEDVINDNIEADTNQQDKWIEYSDLVNIIEEYYSKKGIYLDRINYDYLKDTLVDTMNNTVCLVINNIFGESMFNLTAKEILIIMKTEYLKKGYHLDDVIFDQYGVKINYRQLKNNKQLETNKQNELTNKDMKHRYQIVKRERAMDDITKSKVKSGIIAGVCILGTCVGVLINEISIPDAIQNELNSLFPQKILVNNIGYVSSLTQLLTTALIGLSYKYFRNNDNKSANEILDIYKSQFKDKKIEGQIL